MKAPRVETWWPNSRIPSPSDLVQAAFCRPGEVLQRHLHQIRGENPAASFSATVMAPAWAAVCKLLLPAPAKNMRFDRSAKQNPDKDFKKGTMLCQALDAVSMQTNWEEVRVREKNYYKKKPGQGNSKLEKVIEN